jgi:hypothetical protein
MICHDPVMAVPRNTPQHLSDADGDAWAAALASAEQLIISTIERECEALRTGRYLAASALRDRLSDAARLYLETARATRASLDLMEDGSGVAAELEERRRVFSALLRVELAVLATERAAARPDALPELSGRPRAPHASQQARRRRLRL